MDSCGSISRARTLAFPTCTRSKMSNCAATTSVPLTGQRVKSCPWSSPVDKLKEWALKLDSFSLQVSVFRFKNFKIDNFFKKWSFLFYFDSIEYSIPGTPSPLGGCNFTYLSASKKRGDFNSPRHPARYPSNLTCTYNFVLSRGDESVRLYFDQFKVRSANDSTIFYGFVFFIITNFSSCVCRPTTITLTITHWFSFYRNHCREDWVEIYNVFPRGREVLLGRYCGDSTPGPVESDAGTIGLKVIYVFLSLFCWQLVFIPSATLIGSTIKLQLHFTPSGYFAHWRRGCLQRLQSQIHVRRK